MSSTASGLRNAPFMLKQIFSQVPRRGKRLFENDARPCALRLVASKVSRIGVVMSTYVPAGDIPLVWPGRAKRERIDPARQDGYRCDVNMLFTNCAR